MRDEEESTTVINIPARSETAPPATYLSRIWEHRTCRDEGRGIRAELACDSSACTSGLVYLHDNILALDISAVHGFFRFTGIFFSPEFNYASVLAERSLRSYGCQSTERTEQVVELRVREPRR